MSPRKTCETCGAEIPENAPGGACPACLLGGGLKEESPFDRAELAEAFPHLEIGEVLGRGGMGVVYRARQKTLDRDVALKILPPDLGKDRAFAERFTREARALAKLSHPNVVTIHEAGQAGDLLYLVMEFVEGVNLRQAQAAGRLAPEKALAIVPQICDALQYAHDRGVVHRDIKPENILIDRSGEVKIADFGLAKLLGPLPAETRLTGTEQVMGTFHYLAPEQIKTPKDVDHRADIYSLGVVFYEMLTGELPIGRFPRPSERVQVDVRLDDIVLRALELERDRRWQKVSEVKTGLEGVTCGDASPATASAKATAARAASDDGPRLNPFAVGSVVCLPVALFWGALAIALGARDEVGVLVGLSIVLIGVILSMIAIHEIRRAPGRYRGLKLAKAGFAIPIVLGVALAIGLYVLNLVVEAQVTEDRRRAETEAEKEEVRSVAHRFLRDLDRMGLEAPVARLLPMVSPAERDRLLAGDGDLGLIRFDQRSLAKPLAQFTVESVELDGPDRSVATVTARNGEERLRFALRKMDGSWYLTLQPVIATGLGLAEARRKAVRDGAAETARRYLTTLSRLDGTIDQPALAEMLTSPQRAWILEAGPGRLEYIFETADLGIVLFDHSILGAPLSEFEIEAIGFDDPEEMKAAEVTIAHGDERIVFGMKQVLGKWYLDAEKFEHTDASGAELPKGFEKRRKEVRGRVTELLAWLVAADNRQSGEDVRRLVDPVHNTKLIGRDRDELEKEWFEGKHGLALFDHSVLGHPLAEFGISTVHPDPDNPYWATVQIAAEHESLRFRIVWRRQVGGDRAGPDWFLALAPIERHGRNGKIWSESERAAIRTRIEGLLLDLPRKPDLADLEPILAAVDPRERERLRAQSVEELKALQAEDRLGMAFVDADSLPTIGPSSSAADVKVEGDEGTHTWRMDEHRVTFPIVRVEGEWYLGVGRVRRDEAR